MQRTAIVCASPEELRPALRALPLEALELEFCHGLGSLKFDGSEIDFCAVGTGALLAKRGVGEILDSRAPDEVIVTGTAGGLSPEVASGDSVLASWVTTKDSESGLHPRIQASFELSRKLSAALNHGGIAVRPGGIFTSGEKIICTRQEKRQIWLDSDAIVVDMESFTVAKLCAQRAVPWAALRFVSDSASDDLPESLNDLFEPSRGMDLVRLGAWIAGQPDRAVELGKQNSNATDSLRSCLPFLVNCLARR